MGLILPGRFSRQPQQAAAVNPNLAQFLPQRLVNFALGAYDAITGTYLTTVGSGVMSRISGQLGVGLQFGDAAGATYLSAAIRAERDNSMTMVWVGQSPSGSVVRDFSASLGTIPIWNNAGTFDTRVGGADFTAAGTWATAQDQVVVITVSATAVKVFANGVLVINGGAPGGSSIAISPWVIHRNGVNAQGTNSTSRMWAVFAKPFPDALAIAISANPSLMYQPPARKDWLAEAAGGGGAYTLTAAPGAFTLTGNATGLKADRKLVAAPGSFALTGGVTGLTAARRLTATSGSFSVTGSQVGLSASRKLVAAAGSFAITGTSTSLRSARRLAMGAGSFALTGIAATLKATRRLAADAGSFAITGNNATLTYTPIPAGTVLTAQTGAFTMTGGAASLTVTRRMSANSAAFALTGNAAGLAYGRRLTASTGVFALGASPAAFRVARRLAADAGSYVLTGIAVNLVYSGVAQSRQYPLAGQQQARPLAGQRQTYPLEGQA